VTYGSCADQVVRLLLEAYDEPTFSDRPTGSGGRGRHIALREMANAWTGTARFIQGDIADCFGSLDHDMMIKGLSENIHDNRFLRLARNMPTAGYLEEGSWDPTRSGGLPRAEWRPRSTCTSWTSSSKTVLIPDYNPRGIPGTDPAYLELQYLLAKAHRRGDRASARTLRRRMVSPPSADPE
jgi:hypothetical protein